jgi:hypothetical protein
VYIEFVPADSQKKGRWLVPGPGQYKSGQGHGIENNTFKSTKCIKNSQQLMFPSYHSPESSISMTKVS